ncbi:holo-[acyl-carrier-protein] synthase [candidate division WOR-1 bacterium RIFOXYA12_FULL_52_29]|uniref:Holo-[acyl-carrier-protein] synthase n=1 Tax=candidate division WOR-1 bacterium RIFOXYC12_FULL_54_18 TaxID=1802584 RepID=A0A1F4T5B1_UNCSA|nr:MAG: holo-[acyl-carrier-protein] synthase [candidate division WOR-1 bacterium RIFOXYA2_FULL_51_19]OGC17339.1 MAG: holo-[acyl-carrier-protein] synthase [candidate division WOR-1 bacterium RIFOXYA12_FULL_52_29]OGC27323.1 MAG: holo-[acyl-carrier-protein] synthase [candidate division WOR-1 bacterium RIFOXYB2_FULL_45_9]OGC27756.1 MAG: holo-[acyl-carrier-protein] synthase [candidate division WOR-1 bacterium RIFOXYC12_FULL_54_18]OGC30068.1 MAG: holo-[acyl-carrier-protein] synthase [candidate divisi
MKGIGIDIIEIGRIKDAVNNYGEKFLRRVYSPTEIKYCTRQKAYRIPELAVRFAAKEAYSKAMGTGIKGFGRSNRGLEWQDIEIVNNQDGKPHLSFQGKILDNVQVSLSHSRDYAVASVYVES